MSEEMTVANKEKLVSDLKVVISDTEELLRATAGAAGEKGAVVDKTKAAARATDDFVHEEPWKAVGVAAALGLALGVLIGRR
jgi:ElaB/YqjD/DUF883 family membrane-anchored ribosome-binding protein